MIFNVLYVLICCCICMYVLILPNKHQSITHISSTPPPPPQKKNLKILHVQILIDRVYEERKKEIISISKIVFLSFSLGRQLTWVVGVFI